MPRYLEKEITSISKIVDLEPERITGRNAMCHNHDVYDQDGEHVARIELLKGLPSPLRPSSPHAEMNIYAMRNRPVDPFVSATAPEFAASKHPTTAPTHRMSPHLVRQALRYIADKHPDLKSVYGNRITGIAKSRGSGEDVEFDLDQARKRRESVDLKPVRTLSLRLQHEQGSNVAGCRSVITRFDLMEGWDLSSEGFSLKPSRHTEQDLENHPHFEYQHRWNVHDSEGNKIASIVAQPKHVLPGERTGATTSEFNYEPESLAKAFGWKKAFDTDSGRHFEHKDLPGHELIIRDENWTHYGVASAPWHYDDNGDERPEAEGQNWNHYNIHPDFRGHLEKIHGKPSPTYNHVELDVSTNDEHPSAGAKPETDAGPKFDVGAHLVRRSLQHLAKNAYPLAQTFGGSRTTGASPGTYQLMQRQSILRGMPEARYETISVATGKNPEEVLNRLVTSL